MNLINGKTLMLDRMSKVKKPFKGKDYTQPKVVSLGGGIGSRSGANPTFPTAGSTVQVDLVANCKKLYARMDIDREAMIAGKTSEQVFIDSTKHEMKSKALRYALDLNRQFYGDGKGSLGRLSVDPATGTTLTFTAATWNENYFMEGDSIEAYADNGSGILDTTTKRAGGPYTITAINPTARTLTIAAAGAAIEIGDHICLGDAGGSNAGNELTGFYSHIDDQSSTIHGVAKGTYFRARGIYKDASGAAVSIDLLNQICEIMTSRSTETPEMIVTSPYQWRIISQLLENSKAYYAKDSDKGKMGFGALEYFSPLGGVLPIHVDRFLPKEKLYFVRPKAFKMIMREDFGWFDDDGTTIMRKADTDGYEARYGGYVEMICEDDSSNGVLDNLAIA